MSNDNNIVPFKGVTLKIADAPDGHPPADEKVVALLEAHLQDAKEGKIRSVAIASVSDKGVAYSAWEPEEGGPALTTQTIGAVSFLHARFLEAALAGMDDA